MVSHQSVATVANPVVILAYINYSFALMGVKAENHLLTLMTMQSIGTL